MYYVYIIQSLISGHFYKGYTTDYMKRLMQHNQGESSYTRSLRPWKLLYVEAFTTKTAALTREKQLKKCNKQYLLWLITQEINILNK